MSPQNGLTRASHPSCDATAETLVVVFFSEKPKPSYRYFPTNDVEKIYVNWKRKPVSLKDGAQVKKISTVEIQTRKKY